MTRMPHIRRISPATACAILAVASVVSGLARPAAAADRMEALRQQMVDETVVAAGVKNPRVIAAMRATPRHEFVPADDRKEAYFDMAIPIGHGQTISPPFVVASMTEHLDPQPTDRVLEIGTGSGYQAAVLSPLVKEVYTIEIQEPLGLRARQTFNRLNYKNIHTKIGDGYLGWPEKAPFDKIIVTCSPENIPRPLVDQLREGGRMIVPVGQRFQQVLYLYHKQRGKLVREAIEATMFVPMTGTAESLRQVQYDAEHPALANGGMEQSTLIAGVPDGWYYVRQGRLEQSDSAPQGRRFLTCTNRETGKISQALQAFGVDGRKIRELDVSLWIKGRDIRTPPFQPAKRPRLILTFYDENRGPIDQEAMGPWTGTFDWVEKRARVPVPEEARVVVLYIGLLGATGEISFDDVRVAAVSP